MRTRPPAETCAACSTHRRPRDVPWQQHIVGCPVRAQALSSTVDPVETASLDLPVTSQFVGFRDSQIRQMDGTQAQGRQRPRVSRERHEGTLRLPARLAATLDEPAAAPTTDQT
jgi:hypothetical protein